MVIEYSFISLTFHVATILAVVFGIFILRRRPAPGSFYLAMFEFSVAIWALGLAMQVIAGNIENRYFWAKFSYIGASLGPVLYLLFSLDFVSVKNRITWLHFVFLSLYPLLFIFFTFTNEQHHLIWESIEVSGNTNLTIFTYGDFFWLFLSTGYAFLAAGVILLIVSISRVPYLYKYQIVLLLIASIISIAANLSYITNINPVPGMDWTPLAFTLAGIMIILGVTRFRMFDLIPVAHRQIFDSIVDPVILLDQNDLVLEGNPAFRKEFNITRYDYKRPLRDFITTPECIEFIQEDKPFEYKKEGDYGVRYFDIYVTPIRDKKNGLIGKLLVLRNITPRKKIEKSLMIANEQMRKEISEKEKLIGDLKAFAHSVAHDLKNPVSNIIYLHQMISESCSDESRDIQVLIKNLGVTGYNLNQIIDDILLLATIRHQEIRLEKINMGDTVKEAIKRLDRNISQVNCTVIIPDEWPEIQGYHPWLTQVWENLITNGLRYGGNPPLLEIGFEDLGDMIKFWIKDNGDGLPEEITRNLFNEQARVKTSGKGHGLGLSIVKRVIEKLGGELYVTSENLPGKGCIFSFALPTANLDYFNKQAS